MNIIVALADNLAIGKNNNLLWHISEDLKYFKRITTGSVVIMGRKTYESIGKPLPNRTNIIISKTLDQIEGAFVCKSLNEALRLFPHRENETFIIGGGEIYKLAMPIATKLYITQVHTSVEDADTFFPNIDYNNWIEVFRECHKSENAQSYSFDFVVFEHK